MDLLKEIDDYLMRDVIKHYFFQLYSFTTENINGYLPLFDLKDKSLLTVGSSGDQVINASLEGCEDITVCDVCSLSKYYYYLKVASLLSLDRDDFLRFLLRTKYSITKDYNPHLLTKKLFNMVKNNLKSLDYDSYKLWEYVFKKYNNLYFLFKDDINPERMVIHCNKYLKNDYNYNKTRKTIMNTNVSFINEDIKEATFDRKFDNIWLSNVVQYLKYDSIMPLVDNIKEYLKHDGKILLCYYWNTVSSMKGFQVGSGLYDKIIVPGTSKDYGKNSVLVYKK